MEMSICKVNKNNVKKQNLNRKQKYFMIKQMHQKIKEKYNKMYPNLKKAQIKVLSAVVLIQRLWRQTKVKLMIGQFLSPRGANTSFTSPRNVHASYSYNELYDRASNRCVNKQTTSLIQYPDDSGQKLMRNVKQGINLTQRS